nr:hypothetical protein [Tanacetum cinerariifolium]
DLTSISSDSPLLGVNTPRSDEDRLKLMELLVFLPQKEVVIREILELDDAEGIICLPNEEIFAGLAQMGYEKPSTKLTFYKNQVGDLSTHTTRFISPALTEKVFANMRSVGKGFLGVETPLFKGMLITRQPAEEGVAEAQAEIYNLDLDHSSKVLSIQEDDSEVQEVVEVVTTAKLITDVVTAASQVSAACATISAAKPSIPVAAPTVVAAYTRRRKGDQIELDAEYARKLQEEINRDHEEFNKDIDWDATMDYVNQKSKNPQYIKRYQGMKKRPQTESEARK